MSLAAFKRIFPKDPQLSLVETNTASALAPVLQTVFLGGIFMANIPLTAGAPTAINHGLGRPARGWFLADNQADCRIWRTSGALPDKQILLNTSADTTVSLVIF